jgi:predicted Zn-dependent protease
MSRLPVAIAAVALLTCPIICPIIFAIHAQARDPSKDAQRAQELVAAGQLDQAIHIYQDLVRASPDNPVLLLNLSVAEYTAKHFREAIANATAALKLKPDLLPARLFLGASYVELGEFTLAIDSLQLVIAADPRERNGRLMLGEALLGAGRPAAAVDHLKAAAEMLPANPRVWYGLGRAQEALGIKPAASEAWERLMALPVSLESHLHAAQVHDTEQRWREAAVEWREALQWAPENRAARVALAASLFRSRDYDAAMATLKPLLTGESAGSAAANANVQFLYGASLLNLQQPLEAIPYLRAAVAADAALLPARAALGQGLLQTGKPGEAIPLLQGAVSVDRDGSIHFQLYRAYRLMHREAEARQALAAYQRLRASLAPVP